MPHVLTTAALATVAVLQQAPPEPIVGQWFWVEKQTLVFTPDGKAQTQKDGKTTREGRWTVLDAKARRYTIQWGKDAAKEICEISADGWTITEVREDGTPQRGERIEKPAP